MTFSDVSVLLYEYQAQYRALINVVVIIFLDSALDLPAVTFALDLSSILQQFNLHV